MPYADRARRAANSKRYHEKHKERLARKRKERYDADPEVFRARSRASHRANKERAHATNKKWRDAHKEELKIKNKIWREANREYLRHQARLHRETRAMTGKHGLSRIEKRKLIQLQQNLCAICGKYVESESDLKVDHNHTTGKVRELLCHQCNAIIGFCHENIAILEKAIVYLKKHNSIGSEVIQSWEIEKNLQPMTENIAVDIVA